MLLRTQLKHRKGFNMNAVCRTWDKAMYTFSAKLPLTSDKGEDTIILDKTD